MRQSEFNANQALSASTLEAMQRVATYRRLRDAGFDHVGRSFTTPAPNRAKPIPLRQSVNECSVALGSLILGSVLTALAFFAFFG